MDAVSALDAFGFIDPADPVFVIGDRSGGTGLLAGTLQMGDGRIRTGLGTFAALLTFGRIDVGTVMSDGYRSEVAGIEARLAHTETAVVRYRVG